MSIKTIIWHKDKIRLIDQTKLPLKLEYVNCRNIKSLYLAIKELKVRGAPALGIASSFGLYLGIMDSNAKTYKDFMIELKRVMKYLGSSRPTAINLFYGMQRLLSVVENNRTESIRTLKKLLLDEAFKIMREDQETCRKIAEFGSSLIKEGDSILTVCNAGALATADYGTALGVIYKSKEQGKHIKVYACETRPLLQGARLTTWELQRQKIDVTLLCDNMSASLMKQNKIDKVIVGADRIANNGDAANKIGTYSLAVLAKYHHIPFYIAAPISTFDFSIASGKQIPIEHRDGKEVTELFFKKRIAAFGTKVYNPAFDVTASGLISAIITEKGILKKPFNNLKKRLV